MAFGWERRIRTSISESRVRRPAVRRSPRAIKYYHFERGFVNILKKVVILVVVLSLISSAIFASTYFSFRNVEWSYTYSKKWGNLYFMGIIGTTGVGVAGGYITEIPIRKKVGFLNPVVGKSAYAIALGMNFNKNAPTVAAYFKYELTHLIAPFIYDVQLTAGNYGLPNFGVELNGRSYLTFLNVSLYAKEHMELVFQTYMENFGLLDASFEKLKGTFAFTDEIGPFISSTLGMSVWRNLSLDVGLGYNGNVGLNFGLSSLKSDMNGGWWLRFMSNALGPTFLLDLHLEDAELIAGYSRGAVYVSLER